jgi:hypothetical protein
MSSLAFGQQNISAQDRTTVDRFIVDYVTAFNRHAAAAVSAAFADDVIRAARLQVSGVVEKCGRIFAVPETRNQPALNAFHYTDAAGLIGITPARRMSRAMGVAGTKKG